MHNFEKTLVRHCSPTLAGIKTANLFNYFYESTENINDYIDKWNNELNSRGVTVKLLKDDGKSVLIYVYRKERLKSDFSKDGVGEYLKNLGYNYLNTEDCIDRLSVHICKSGTFPHEIGLFLGYPLCDVVGFIENAGKNYSHIGYWKVYSNEKEAEKLFARFRKCTSVYYDYFKKGTSIRRLTVAG